MAAVRTKVKVLGRVDLRIRLVARVTPVTTEDSREADSSLPTTSIRICWRRWWTWVVIGLETVLSGLRAETSLLILGLVIISVISDLGREARDFLTRVGYLMIDSPIILVATPTLISTPNSLEADRGGKVLRHSWGSPAKQNQVGWVLVDGNVFRNGFQVYKARLGHHFSFKAKAKHFTKCGRKMLLWCNGLDWLNGWGLGQQLKFVDVTNGGVRHDVVVSQDSWSLSNWLYINSQFL